MEARLLLRHYKCRVSVRVSAMVMVSYVLNSVDMFWRF